MKTIRTFLFVTLVALICSTFSAFGQNDKKTTDNKTSVVVFHSDIDCNNCKMKIEKNIPFEKGVKDLSVSLKDKTVTVTYRTDKTTPEKLRQAIEKLGYKSEVIE